MLKRRRSLEKMMRERKELVPVKCMTDEQIASAIRDLDPDPSSERSGDDTVAVICFSLLILLIAALAVTSLYLRTY